MIDSRASVVVVVEEGKSRPVGKKGEKGGMTSAHDSRRAVESEKMEGIECIKIINYKIHGGRRGRRACKNMKAKSNKVYVCSLSLCSTFTQPTEDVCTPELICKFGKIFSRLSHLPFQLSLFLSYNGGKGKREREERNEIFN